MWIEQENIDWRLTTRILDGVAAYQQLVSRTVVAEGVLDDVERARLSSTVEAGRNAVRLFLNIHSWEVLAHVRQRTNKQPDALVQASNVFESFFHELTNLRDNTTLAEIMRNILDKAQSP